MRKSKLLLTEKDYNKLIRNLALKKMGYNRATRRKILRENKPGNKYDDVLNKEFSDLIDEESFNELKNEIEDLVLGSGEVSDKIVNFNVLGVKIPKSKLKRTVDILIDGQPVNDNPDTARDESKKEIFTLNNITGNDFKKISKNYLKLGMPIADAEVFNKIVTRTLPASLAMKTFTNNKKMSDYVRLYNLLYNTIKKDTSDISYTKVLIGSHDELTDSLGEEVAIGALDISSGLVLEKIGAVAIRKYAARGLREAGEVTAKQMKKELKDQVVEVGSERIKAGRTQRKQISDARTKYKNNFNDVVSGKTKLEQSLDAGSLNKTEQDEFFDLIVKWVDSDGAALSTMSSEELDKLTNYMFKLAASSKDDAARKMLNYSQTSMRETMMIDILEYIKNNPDAVIPDMSSADEVVSFWIRNTASGKKSAKLKDSYKKAYDSLEDDNPIYNMLQKEKNERRQDLLAGKSSISDLKADQESYLKSAQQTAADAPVFKEPMDSGRYSGGMSEPINMASLEKRVQASTLPGVQQQELIDLQIELAQQRFKRKQSFNQQLREKLQDMTNKSQSRIDDAGKQINESANKIFGEATDTNKMPDIMKSIYADLMSQFIDESDRLLLVQRRLQAESLALAQTSQQAEQVFRTTFEKAAEEIEENLSKRVKDGLKTQQGTSTLGGATSDRFTDVTAYDPFFGETSATFFDKAVGNTYRAFRQFEVIKGLKIFGSTVLGTLIDLVGLNLVRMKKPLSILKNLEGAMIALRKEDGFIKLFFNQEKINKAILEAGIDSKKSKEILDYLADGKSARRFEDIMLQLGSDDINVRNAGKKALHDEFEKVVELGLYPDKQTAMKEFYLAGFEKAKEKGLLPSDLKIDTSKLTITEDGVVSGFDQSLLPGGFPTPDSEDFKDAVNKLIEDLTTLKDKLTDEGKRSLEVRLKKITGGNKRVSEVEKTKLKNAKQKIREIEENIEAELEDLNPAKKASEKRARLNSDPEYLAAKKDKIAAEKKIAEESAPMDKADAIEEIKAAYGDVLEQILVKESSDGMKTAVNTLTPVYKEILTFTKGSLAGQLGINKWMLRGKAGRMLAQMLDDASNDGSWLTQSQINAAIQKVASLENLIENKAELSYQIQIEQDLDQKRKQTGFYGLNLREVEYVNPEWRVYNKFINENIDSNQYKWVRQVNSAINRRERKTFRFTYNLSTKKEGDVGIGGAERNLGTFQTEVLVDGTRWRNPQDFRENGGFSELFQEVKIKLGMNEERAKRGFLFPKYEKSISSDARVNQFRLEQFGQLFRNAGRRMTTAPYHGFIKDEETLERILGGDEEVGGIFRARNNATKGLGLTLGSLSNMMIRSVPGGDYERDFASIKRAGFSDVGLPSKYVDLPILLTNTVNPVIIKGSKKETFEKISKKESEYLDYINKRDEYGFTSDTDHSDSSIVNVKGRNYLGNAYAGTRANIFANIMKSAIAGIRKVISDHNNIPKETADKLKEIGNINSQSQGLLQKLDARKIFGYSPNFESIQTMLLINEIESGGEGGKSLREKLLDYLDLNNPQSEASQLFEKTIVKRGVTISLTDSQKSYLKSIMIDPNLTNHLTQYIDNNAIKYLYTTKLLQGAGSGSRETRGLDFNNSFKGFLKKLGMKEHDIKLLKIMLGRDRIDYLADRKDLKKDSKARRKIFVDDSFLAMFNRDFLKQISKNPGNIIADYIRTNYSELMGDGKDQINEAKLTEIINLILHEEVYGDIKNGYNVKALVEFTKLLSSYGYNVDQIEGVINVIKQQGDTAEELLGDKSYVEKASELGIGLQVDPGVTEKEKQDIINFLRRQTKPNDSETLDPDPESGRKNPFKKIEERLARNNKNKKAILKESSVRNIIKKLLLKKKGLLTESVTEENWNFWQKVNKDFSDATANVKIDDQDVYLQNKEKINTNRGINNNARLGRMAICKLDFSKNGKIKLDIVSGILGSEKVAISTDEASSVGVYFGVTATKARLGPASDINVSEIVKTALSAGKGPLGTANDPAESPIFVLVREVAPGVVINYDSRSSSINLKSTDDLPPSEDVKTIIDANDSATNFKDAIEAAEYSFNHEDSNTFSNINTLVNALNKNILFNKRKLLITGIPADSYKESATTGMDLPDNATIANLKNIIKSSSKKPIETSQPVAETEEVNFNALLDNLRIDIKIGKKSIDVDTYFKDKMIGTPISEKFGKDSADPGLDGKITVGVQLLNPNPAQPNDPSGLAYERIKIIFRDKIKPLIKANIDNLEKRTIQNLDDSSSNEADTLYQRLINRGTGIKNGYIVYDLRTKEGRKANKKAIASRKKVEQEIKKSESTKGLTDTELKTKEDFLQIIFVQEVEEEDMMEFELDGSGKKQSLGGNPERFKMKKSLDADGKVKKENVLNFYARLKIKVAEDQNIYSHKSTGKVTDGIKLNKENAPFMYRTDSLGFDDIAKKGDQTLNKNSPSLLFKQLILKEILTTKTIDGNPDALKDNNAISSWLDDIAKNNEYKIVDARKPADVAGKEAGDFFSDAGEKLQKFYEKTLGRNTDADDFTSREGYLVNGLGIPVSRYKYDELKKRYIESETPDSYSKTKHERPTIGGSYVPRNIAGDRVQKMLDIYLFLNVRLFGPHAKDASLPEIQGWNNFGIWKNGWNPESYGNKKGVIGYGGPTDNQDRGGSVDVFQAIYKAAYASQRGPFNLEYVRDAYEQAGTKGWQYFSAAIEENFVNKRLNKEFDGMKYIEQAGKELNDLPVGYIYKKDGNTGGAVNQLAFLHDIYHDLRPARSESAGQQNFDQTRSLQQIKQAIMKKRTAIIKENNFKAFVKGDKIVMTESLFQYFVKQIVRKQKK